MPSQLPLDEALLLGLWLEAVAYGFFLCLFCGTIVLSFGRGRHRSDIHSKIMIGISSIMFFISTLHLVLGIYRLCQAFVAHAEAPGGISAYFANVMRWEDIAINVLYGTQEVLGNAAAVYRCYVLWSRDWRVIALPLMLLVGSLASGCTIIPPLATVDTPQTLPTDRSIKAFYSFAVAQNIITTGLMAFRIWRTSSESAKYYKMENTLLPIVRVLIESAALQLIVEVLTLGLYAGGLNAVLLPQGLVTPIVGITFNAIAIRIKLRMIRDSTTHSQVDPVQTIGSMPMKRITVETITEIDIGAGEAKAREGTT
ncbi:hypothetical protein PLEOSDRAFT_1107100 [Pleurotus ostreatus PC15]|uniref:Uncharacterized protein n=2 Tax=Pleurotus TaxID=5320 RepID=A0A067NRJ2_PLEO1|nr:hypothetical protein CCMSSC00406_0009735 [Pleurotus cornucopiae]KDQ26236.1 hypothetical protein PLEOSDRAFT_1107100 [Pleurotus ostreatus PC15]